MKIKCYKMMFFIFLLLPLSLYATDYYVDIENGNNNNDGLTESTAWRTIENSNDVVRAGDVVLIMQGTYTNDTIAPTHSGTEDNYITYRNYPGHEVTLTEAYNFVDIST